MPFFGPGNQRSLGMGCKGLGLGAWPYGCGLRGRSTRLQFFHPRQAIVIEHATMAPSPRNTYIV